MTRKLSMVKRLAFALAGLFILSIVPVGTAQAQTPYWVADGPAGHRICGMWFRSNAVGPNRYQATNVPSAACTRLGFGPVYGWSRAGNRSVTLWDRFGRRMRTFYRIPGRPGMFRSGNLVFRPANTAWPGSVAACSNVFRPVCGWRGNRWTTFRNVCWARRAGATSIRGGRCNVVGPGPGPGCSNVYRPVCGWFRGRWTNFRNSCFARRSRATSIRRGRCGAPGQGRIRRFNYPRTAGFPLDHCWTWGRNCGFRAANSFCRRVGYARATNFRTYRPGRSRIYRTGQICRGGFCTAYRYIRCTR